MENSFNHFVAIDVGGSYIRGAILSKHDLLPNVPEITYTTNHENGAYGVIDQIIDISNQLIKKRKHTLENRVVSLSVPGLVDSVEGIVRLALNLPEWKNIHLGTIISEAMACPVLVENDANCAALGEWHYSFDKKVSSLVYITISTGIGAGIIANSQLLRGASGAAGELGHVSVDIDGEVCHECRSSKGCLTTLSSGKGILNFVRQNFLKNKNTILYARCEGDPLKITELLIEQVANMGDELALAAYRRAGYALGQGLINIIHLLDPEVIVLGGGVLKAENLFYPALIEILEDRLLDKSRIKVIKKSTLGDMQGIAGAFINALQNIDI